MAIGWTGIGQGLGQGLQTIANVFLQKAMMAKQPEWELEALKKKAQGIAEMVTPDWSVLSPEKQNEIAGGLLKQMALPKPDLLSQMRDMMVMGITGMPGMGADNSGAAAQPGGMPMAPRNVAPPPAKIDIPGQTPKFQNTLYDPEDGQPFTVDTYDKFRQAIAAGALLKPPDTLPGMGGLPGM